MENIITVEAFKGKVLYFDTNLFIYAVEQPESATSILDIVSKLFTMATNGEIQVITSELSLAEVLAGSYNKNNELVTIYDDLLSDRNDFSVYPVNRSILKMAAFTRTIVNVALADAIHVATALNKKADYFITNDVKLKVPEGGLQKIIIVDIVL